jgi:uncharacterized membrane protein (UPF0127 family)
MQSKEGKASPWKLGIGIVILLAVFIITLMLILGIGKNVCIGKKCFRAEVVDTPMTREVGLMYRTHLDEDRGMLFVFEKEDLYPFWMKNTLIPLDMIWINQDRKVVFIYRNATPCGEGECPPLYPDANAKYVLEVNAGLSDRYGIKVGDEARIR